MQKMPPQIWECPQPLHLESGDVIDDLRIAYHTYGQLNDRADNVIWVCHALTADSEVADWWPHTVEPGKFLDPSRNFIVCANILGSHYGTTGPLTPARDTGVPRYDAFPRVTVRDMVECHRRLARHLGIRSIYMLIGSSLGGFQCMEWAITDPDMIRNLVLIATAPCTTPWAAAFNESQRMAVFTDSTYGQPTPEAGLTGMGVARSIALLSYRGPSAYDATQPDASERPDIWTRRVHSYQRHQALKLEQRFNAYSYVRMSQAVDSHDVGRGRGGIAEALKKIRARTLIVSISTDILFPPEGHDPLRRHISGAQYRLIDSTFGHDGFLIEHALLNNIIKDFLAND